MKKRIASLLLALPLCLTLLPTTALAEDEAASDRTVIATVEDTPLPLRRITVKLSIKKLRLLRIGQPTPSSWNCAIWMRIIAK